MAQRMSLAEMKNALQEAQTTLMEVLQHANQTTLYTQPSAGTYPLGVLLAHIHRMRVANAEDIIMALQDPTVGIGHNASDIQRLRRAAESGEGYAGVSELRENLRDSYQRLVEALNKVNADNLNTQLKHNDPDVGRVSFYEFLQTYVVEHEIAHSNEASRILT